MLAPDNVKVPTPVFSIDPVPEIVFANVSAVAFVNFKFPLSVIALVGVREVKLLSS